MAMHLIMYSLYLILSYIYDMDLSIYYFGVEALISCAICFNPEKNNKITILHGIFYASRYIFYLISDLGYLKHGEYNINTWASTLNLCLFSIIFLIIIKKKQV